MKNRIQFIAGVLLMASLAGNGLSHAAGTQNPKENAAQDRRVQHLESLSKSKQDIGAISTGIDALLKTVKEAAATNDKAKMKAALNASEKHLTEMKAHTESCMKNMESMESMESRMSKEGHMEGHAAEKSP